MRGGVVRGDSDSRMVRPSGTARRRAKAVREAAFALQVLAQRLTILPGDSDGKRDTRQSQGDDCFAMSFASSRILSFQSSTSWTTFHYDRGRLEHGMEIRGRNAQTPE